MSGVSESAGIRNCLAVRWVSLMLLVALEAKEFIACTASCWCDFFCRAVKNEAALRSSCCVRLMLLMEVVPATVTKESKTSKWHIEGLAVLVLKINTHAAPTPQN